MPSRSITLRVEDAAIAGQLRRWIGELNPRLRGLRTLRGELGAVVICDPAGAEGVSDSEVALVVVPAGQTDAARRLLGHRGEAFLPWPSSRDALFERLRELSLVRRARDGGDGAVVLAMSLEPLARMARQWLCDELMGGVVHEMSNHAVAFQLQLAKAGTAAPAPAFRKTVGECGGQVRLCNALLFQQPFEPRLLQGAEGRAAEIQAAVLDVIERSRRLKHMVLRALPGPVADDAPLPRLGVDHDESVAWLLLALFVVTAKRFDYRGSLVHGWAIEAGNGEAGRLTFRVVVRPPDDVPPQDALIEDDSEREHRDIMWRLFAECARATGGRLRFTPGDGNDVAAELSVPLADSATDGDPEEA